MQVFKRSHDAPVRAVRSRSISKLWTPSRPRHRAMPVKPVQAKKKTLFGKAMLVAAAVAALSLGLAGR
jgi:hypothetical protein